MALRLDGTDVRVAWDGRVWVLVAAGVVGAGAQWRRVGVEEIELDAARPEEVITRYGRHPVRDVGTNVVELSHVLGVPRRDPERVRELWRPGRHLQGSSLVIDFEAKELAGAADEGELVYPFSAIGGVGPTRLVAKVRRWAGVAIGDYVLPREAMARAMGVGVVEE